MIELADVIGELRRELQQAMQAGEGELLRFEPSSDPVIIRSFETG